VAAALEAVRRIAPTYVTDEGPAPLMPALIEAVRARASVGEISDVLRDVWGEYRPG
jgi:methylmalonyl-CoA mutase N-terminal domain/subunit